VALSVNFLRVSLVKTKLGTLERLKAMQTREAIMANNSKVLQNIPSGGGIGNWVTRVLGCWHKEMSRPFSNKGQAYRTCLNCGASRKFNVGRWEMQGSFYYARPKVGNLRPVNGLAAR
jgi:hypothetical protein